MKIKSSTEIFCHILNSRSWSVNKSMPHRCGFLLLSLSRSSGS